MSTFLPHEYARTHPHSIGFPAPVVDLRIDNPDPRTGVGELLVRGGNVVIGYWQDPVRTADAFRDGWLFTGDLARIDSDGLVYLVDRGKDMINRGGEKVYCVEVENVLAAAPGVFEVAVVGVPDEVMGEKVGAVVVPTSDAAFDKDAFLAHAATGLADFKVPQYLALRAEPLPRNAGGKVLKPRLREETEWGAPLR
jgi:acyl-CoA synthetase (AMP-forming)/AMP-acid ligase II